MLQDSLRSLGFGFSGRGAAVTKGFFGAGAGAEAVAGFVLLHAIWLGQKLVRENLTGNFEWLLGCSPRQAAA